MTLILHAGAEEVPFEGLREAFTPEPTRSHVPIPHYRLVDMMRHTLSYYGHRITEEHHGLTPDGNRYFGVLSLKSKYGDYEDTVGLRNSHDKKFPVGISMGARVFVCDNLSFMAEHVIKRKHTVNAVRDLPGLVAQIVEPLADIREAQQIVFERYKQTVVSPRTADYGIMEMYRRGVINVQRIADVQKEWEEPSFVGFEMRNAWRLFNAVTHALEGKVTMNPNSTQKLHEVIDGVCEVIPCQPHYVDATAAVNL
jgi:hypothetical protein